MHEHGLRAGGLHQLPGDAVGQQVPDALGPHLVRLAHGHPDIGIEHLGASGGVLGVLVELQNGAGILGNGLTLLHQPGVGKIFLGGTHHKVHPHLGAAHHQGIAHVVAGVAVINVLDALQRAEAFLDREKIRQDLGGVSLVGEAVPHGNGGVAGQLLHHLLAVAPVFDAVEHGGQHPGGVGDAFLFAQLGAGVQIGDVHTQVVPGHLEAAAGAGTALFKDQGDVFALEIFVGDAGFLQRLEAGGQVHQLLDLFRGNVQQLEKVLSLHGLFQMQHTVASFLNGIKHSHPSPGGWMGWSAGAGYRPSTALARKANWASREGPLTLPGEMRCLTQVSREMASNRSSPNRGERAR